MNPAYSELMRLIAEKDTFTSSEDLKCVQELLLNISKDDIIEAHYDILDKFLDIFTIVQAYICVEAGEHIVALHDFIRQQIN